MRALWRLSVWAPGAIPADNVTRNQRRFWWPADDALTLLVGFNAAWFGSRILDRLYGDTADLIGIAVMILAAVSFIGIAFPRLWLVEIAARLLLGGLTAGYIFAVLTSPSPEQIANMEAPNWFIAAVLARLLFVDGARIDGVLMDQVNRRAVDRRLNKREGSDG